MSEALYSHFKAAEEQIAILNARIQEIEADSMAERAAVNSSFVQDKLEIAKRNELHKFVVLPKRWIVERTFAWIEKCHRLWKNCERKINTSLQMIALAFIALILKRS
jgi:transposase